MAKRVAIIGGGAAGMMTAAQLIEQDFGGEIVLFERNKSLGAKVIISGGGRCNVTTGIMDVQTLAREKYPRGGRFLVPALKAFGPVQIRAWFEAHGVPLKEEKDGRVFPISNDGKDVVRVFEELFRTQTVRVRFGAAVKNVTYRTDGTFDITYAIDGAGECGDVFDAVVLTTGGNAYAHTGSRGDGYAFARTLGHTVTPLGPSLNSFLTQENWAKALSGNSFAHARISAQRADGSSAVAVGPLLLTHFGISGPAVFAFAAHVAHECIDQTHLLTAHVQIDAARDASAWDTLLQETFARSGMVTIAHVLKQWMTTRFAQAVCMQCDTDPEQKCAELSKKQRQNIARFLGDGFVVTIAARRAGDEFVTAGGVCLDEVDAKTGMSRIVPGLYFAGEILDVDGVTGGFNLTASWAMGFVVGRALAKSEDDVV